ncbi:MAG: enoyl-CoA hydratase/isomerase family protein [Thermodesulfobacteriota bacterium]
MNEPVKLDIIEGIASITLNQPKAFNAFGLDMVQMLSERLTELATDQKVVGVIITGEGNAFCAGADLKWLSGSGKSYGEALHEASATYHQAILEIRRMPKPVVAAINGIAAGGGFSMALACDFRIMEVSAVLHHAYTTNGLSIDGGGTFTLPRLVGMARAMEIAVFDCPISSDKALSWGLVTEVAEDGQAVKRAIELIKKIKKIPSSSFAACKRLITDSFHTSFETQLEKERETLSWCADHLNGREGIEAFLEKRKPVYT